MLNLVLDQLGEHGPTSRPSLHLPAYMRDLDSRLQMGDVVEESLDGDVLWLSRYEPDFDAW